MVWDNNQSETKALQNYNEVIHLHGDENITGIRTTVIKYLHCSGSDSIFEEIWTLVLCFPNANLGISYCRS